MSNLVWFLSGIMLCKSVFFFFFTHWSFYGAACHGWWRACSMCVQRSWSRACKCQLTEKADYVFKHTVHSYRVMIQFCWGLKREGRPTPSLRSWNCCVCFGSVRFRSCILKRSHVHAYIGTRVRLAGGRSPSSSREALVDTPGLACSAGR